VQRGWGHGTCGASRREIGEKGERGMKQDEEEDTGKRREDKAVKWAPLVVFHVPWTRGALTRWRTRRALSPAGTQAFSKKNTPAILLLPFLSDRRSNVARGRGALVLVCVS
jgi:hypothetical protein